jgi:hypothetical protein
MITNDSAELYNRPYFNDWGSPVNRRTPAKFIRLDLPLVNSDYFSLSGGRTGSDRVMTTDLGR